MRHLLHEQESFSEAHDDVASMLLVTAHEPGRQCERCLVAGGRRENDPSKPEWSTPEAHKIILCGVKVEVDILIKDKQAWLPCQCNSHRAKRTSHSVKTGVGGKF